jgi:hypothetical protein
MALALLVIAGIFAYQHFASHPATAANQDAHVQNPSTAAKPKVTASGSPSVVAQQHQPRKLHIRLTATQNCWVQLKSRTGATLFSGMVYAGNSMNWTEKHRVVLILGNPSGVKVRVNGRNPVPPGTVSMVTLSLHASRVH